MFLKYYYMTLSNYIIDARKGRKRLLSACVSILTESRKICEVGALINQVLPRCFISQSLWLTGQSIESVHISESIDTNQSKSIN